MTPSIRMKLLIAKQSWLHLAKVLAECGYGCSRHRRPDGSLLREGSYYLEPCG